MYALHGKTVLCVIKELFLLYGGHPTLPHPIPAFCVQSDNVAFLTLLVRVDKVVVVERDLHGHVVNHLRRSKISLHTNEKNNRK